jgi:hypothetical protein
MSRYRLFDSIDWRMLRAFGRFSFNTVLAPRGSSKPEWLGARGGAPSGHARTPLAPAAAPQPKMSAHPGRVLAYLGLLAEDDGGLPFAPGELCSI